LKEAEPFKLNLYKPEHLSLRINFPLAVIDKILKNKDKRIERFVLKKVKENGIIKERPIFSPHREYKLLLRRINKHILNKAPLPVGVCGAIVGKSLFDMVNVHCNKEAVYQVDLENFFPNIKYPTIFKMFLKLNCSKDIARLLADLVTFQDSLPQGFPTSPMIANIVASKLDIEQLKICEKNDVSRTRWIDDIVFSGRIISLQSIIPKLVTSIKINHFILNKDKELFTRRKDKPEIVGLTINKHKPYIPLRIIEKLEDYIQIANEFGYGKLRSMYPEEFQKKDIALSIISKIKYIEIFDKNAANELREKLLQKHNIVSSSV